MGCERCGAKLKTAGVGRIPRFCSSRCRVAAHRVRHSLPVELTSRDRWVRFSARKVPLRLDGSAASSTDAKTWTTYRDAKRSTVGVGVGFVLNGDGVVCIDLDHCLIGGVPTAAARRFLDALPGTFVECSPSGDGLHVWGFGSVGRGRKLRRDGLSVEVYGAGRYMTVTGLVFSPGPLADLSGVLADLI